MQLIFLLLFSLLVQTSDSNMDADWSQMVTYEVFVQSFADSNDDGIGDLRGLINRLDYIKNLGADAIWLMPINPSPSYHKYDVTDYREIHPDYGTLDDFKDLIHEAHNRDIKIVMDLVINHCSSKHPWFQSALKMDEEYRDYFVWKKLIDIEAEGNLLKEATGDSDNKHQWNKVLNQDELYFSFFWSGMPDLNYDNPKVRKEVYEIGEFWLKEIGVDGFRLDAAKHIYPDHRAEDNHAFWKEFYEQMKKAKPDVYTIGEVWADLPTQTPFAEGFSSLFNFDLAFSFLETVKQERIVSATIYEHAWKVENDGSPITLFKSSDDVFKEMNPSFTNATFLTNHDQNRVVSFLGNNIDKAKLAASILLTFPGSPYIYNGEELGMRGMKPDEDIRESIIWTQTPDKERTSWRISKYNTDQTIDTAEDQAKDPNSMLNHYKTLIELRKKHTVLSTGSLENFNLEDDQLFAYKRVSNSSEITIIHNLSAAIKSFPMDKKDPIFSSSLATTITKKQIDLQPYSTIIF